jgi:hypothetical protein
MNTDSLTLEKHLKKTTITSNILSIIIALVTGLGVGYGFYFDTTSTLDSHTIQIEEVKLEVKSLRNDITTSAIYQSSSSEQIKALQSNLTDVKASQIRIEDKIDKIIFNTRK